MLLRGKFDKFNIVYLVLLVCTVVFFVYMISVLSTEESDSSVKKIGFTGTYKVHENDVPNALSVDNGGFENQTSPIIMEGHFDRNIAKDQKLHMYMYRVRMRMYKNDELIFSYGYDLDTHIMHTNGIEWSDFVSGGISKRDDIKIRLEAAYASNYKEAYDSFLSNLYVGSDYDLLKHQVWKNILKIAIAAIIFIMGMTILITMQSMRMMATDVRRGYLSCGFLMLCGAICTFINYDYITLIFRNSFMVNLVDFMMQLFICELMLIYLKSYLRTDAFLKIAKVLIIAFSVMMVVYFGLQMNGIMDGIEFAKIAAPVAIAFILLELIFLIRDYRRYQEAQTHRLLLSVFMLVGFTIIEIFHYYITNMFWITVFQFGLMLFTFVQMGNLLTETKKNMLKAAQVEKMEKEVLQNKIAIMLSQIQPHFLYNSLTAIAVLCRMDPQKAEKATIDFAKYLRGNLDSLKQDRPVPFEAELNHVKIYLSLEKMRFESELNIVYDIKCKDFMLPALTIQPLVENSVKYGVGKVKDGGTVTLSSIETETEYRVIVSDDGTGFDPYEKQFDGRTHIGIENVRQRLKAQSKGHLEIISQKGAGTTAVIIIPKGEK